MRMGKGPGLYCDARCLVNLPACLEHLNSPRTWARNLDGQFVGRLSGRLMIRPARRLVVDLDEHHRPGGYKAPAGSQPRQPLAVREPRGTMDIDTTPTQWDRMHTRCRSRRRHHSKPAVEQRIIVLKAERRPGLLVH